jgi:uncharacterized protein YceH (UPF0502 family)
VEIHLTPYQVRIIGSLIEKEITTPDQYPLSLNALTNACNQKSSRDPVLSLVEEEVQRTVDELIKLRLVMENSGFGGRVVKYRQRFCNSEFSVVKLSPSEVAVICVLFLRGPQTAGELRSRCSRLYHFNDLNEVETTLHHLSVREDGPFTARLKREPGKREIRYRHLFGSEPGTNDAVAPFIENGDPETGDNGRLDRLEQQVEDLRQTVESIKNQIDRLVALSRPD